MQKKNFEKKNGQISKTVLTVIKYLIFVAIYFWCSLFAKIMKKNKHKQFYNNFPFKYGIKILHV